LRLLWRMEIGCVDPGRLVFVDEMGAHTSLAPLYAYAPVGERAFFEIPRNRGTNTTLLSSLHLGGMGPSMAVEGATTKEVFDTYVEHFLVPALRPGQLVVMDNLGAHRPKRVRELIEGKGCELVYLPPYSPDLNPIEEAFSKVKDILRKIGARGKEALVEAMGRALGAVSTEDVRGFFTHCGYGAPAQQL
jgi:transposase